VGSVTIRNIDDAIKHSARLAAARNGRSLEAELRALLQTTYAPGGNDRTSKIRAMSGKEFVDHLVAITRPGFEEDPFRPERVSKTNDPFDVA
jgi:antitoxin FitA